VDAPLNTHGIVQPAFIGSGNVIHRKKAESLDLAQAEGLFFYCFQRSYSKMLKDSLYLLGSHMEGCQISGKIPDGMVSTVGHKNGLQFPFRDPFHRKKAVRIMVQDIKRSGAKFIHI